MDRAFDSSLYYGQKYQDAGCRIKYHRLLLRFMLTFFTIQLPVPGYKLGI